MFNVAVAVVNDKVIHSLSNIEHATPGIADEEMRKTLDDVKDELGRAGAAISYPVNWDSERQRRAYFASDGFGHGIPYQRTGAHGEGYYHESTGALYNRTHTLYHKTSQSKYVSGDAEGKGQSRIHAGRWPLAATVIKRHVGLLFSALDKKVRAAIQREGLN